MNEIKESKLDILDKAIGLLTDIYLDICEDLPKYEPGSDLTYQRGIMDGYRQCIHELITMDTQTRISIDEEI